MIHYRNWAKVAIVIGSTSILISACVPSGDGSSNDAPSNDSATTTASIAAVTAASTSTPTTPSTSAEPTTTDAAPDTTLASAESTTIAASPDSTTTAAAASDPEVAAFVHSAVDSTFAAPSMRIDSVAEIAFPSESSSLTVVGYRDVPARIGDITVTNEKNGVAVANVALSDGTTVWQLDEATGPLWTQIELADVEVNDEDFLTPKAYLGQLVMLRSAENIEVGDEDERDGVTGREYTFTTTYSKAEAAAGDLLAEFQTGLSLTGVDDLDIDVVVWIGDDNVIREFRYLFDHPPAVTSMYATISEVGQSFPAPEPPPADEIDNG